MVELLLEYSKTHSYALHFWEISQKKFTTPSIILYPATAASLPPRPRQRSKRSSLTKSIASTNLCFGYSDPIPEQQPHLIKCRPRGERSRLLIYNTNHIISIQSYYFIEWENLTNFSRSFGGWFYSHDLSKEKGLFLLGNLAQFSPTDILQFLALQLSPPWRSPSLSSYSLSAPLVSLPGIILIFFLGKEVLSRVRITRWKPHAKSQKLTAKSHKAKNILIVQANVKANNEDIL